MPRCLLARFLHPLSFAFSEERSVGVQKSPLCWHGPQSAFCILQVQDSGVGVTRRSDDITIGFKARCQRKAAKIVEKQPEQSKLWGLLSSFFFPPSPVCQGRAAKKPAARHKFSLSIGELERQSGSRRVNTCTVQEYLYCKNLEKVLSICVRSYEMGFFYYFRFPIFLGVFSFLPGCHRLLEPVPISKPKPAGLFIHVPRMDCICLRDGVPIAHA